MLPRILLSIAVALLAVACTPRDAVHRPLADPAICAAPQPLNGRWRESASGGDQNPALCFLQRHEMPAERAPGKQGTEDWSDLDPRHRIRDVRGFHLAIVEVQDGGAQPVPAQLQRLTAHLRAQDRAGRQNVVVTFVHGWRHDAALRDADLEKLRTLLGYTRAALNSRCIARAEYCDAVLTGVFVGWRGRAFAEPRLRWDDNHSPWVIGAFPTIWDRKRQSEALALAKPRPLEAILSGIEAELSLRPGDPRRDKMLVFGHSLGGNMLASLMEQKALAAIAAQPVPGLGGAGQRMAPVLGDLVVLLNPAAEATKWTTLQNAERARAGLAPGDPLVANLDGFDRPLFDRLSRWRRMYPIDQRPVYMALTSTGDWWQGERRGRAIKSDMATRVLFPLARWLEGARGREEARAIGHLTPRYASRVALQPGEAAVGATHELSVNRNIGVRPDLLAAREPDSAWCDPANGWLRQARQRQLDSGSATSIGWDYGLTEAEAETDARRLRAARNIARDRNAASVQWRHGLYLAGQPNRLSVAGPHSPFWNVRALDTAIRDHAGWVNYPTWCAISQVLLDDIGGLARTDAEVLETIRAQDTVEAEASE